MGEEKVVVMVGLLQSGFIKVSSQLTDFFKICKKELHSGLLDLEIVVMLKEILAFSMGLPLAHFH